MYTTLISTAQLQSLLQGASPLMVFDCSFELLQPEAGDEQYRQIRVPGSVRADLNRHLSAASQATDAASGGRHPLPSRESFANWLDGLGFDNTMQAVVYDRQGANYCGRLWWMLKWVGHEAAAILDGGLQAWQAGGGATAGGIESEPVRRSVANTGFELLPSVASLVSTSTIERGLGRPGQTLIDARAEPRFRGEVEPLDPVAGHIPGALNRPFALNLDAQGRFKSAAELRAEFEELLAGRDPATVVHHCGSGVSAIPNLLAMEIAGLGRSALYAGSWSEWCSDRSRVIARG